jgi:hypothetical protein
MFHIVVWHKFTDILDALPVSSISRLDYWGNKHLRNVGKRLPDNKLKIKKTATFSLSTVTLFSSS